MDTITDACYEHLHFEDGIELLDYVKEGVLRSIPFTENQKDSNACWAFVLAHLFSNVYYRQYGQYMNFSKQQLIDYAYGELKLFKDGKPKGVAFADAYKFVFSLNGLCSAGDYPFTNILNEPRKLKPEVRQFYPDGPRWDLSHDEVRQCINEKMVVAATTCVLGLAFELDFTKYKDFKIYKRHCFTPAELDAVIDEESKSSKPTKVVNPHAVLVVGHGVDNTDGERFYVIQNSWGEHWGKLGFALVQEHLLEGFMTITSLLENKKSIDKELPKTLDAATSENPKPGKGRHTLMDNHPVPSSKFQRGSRGNLPHGFDPNTCRSVYVGNIHNQVTELILHEVFSAAGPIESCKLIRKEKSSFGFVHYVDSRSVAHALQIRKQLFGQPIKVNYAYASAQREDTSNHFNVFVGDLSPEVTDATLFNYFSQFPSCSDARVMWDQQTQRSRGFGFVSFRNQQDAQSAINNSNGKWLGTRQIRCNWATKGASTSDDKQSSDAKSVVELTRGTSEESKVVVSSDAPENNPEYTTVYVGNLSPEVAQVDLHRHFHSLGAGAIQEVRIQRDKGFGFVRYSTHAEAAYAILLGNSRSYLCGRQIKCSWGNKPTPPGTASNPLPPPVPFADGSGTSDPVDL